MRHRHEHDFSCEECRSSFLYRLKNPLAGVHGALRARGEQCRHERRKKHYAETISVEELQCVERGGVSCKLVIRA